MKTIKNKTNEEIWEEIHTYNNSCRYGDYVLDFIHDEILTVYDFTDFEDLGDLINDALDRGLIYYDDQWDLMKNYQTPQEANFNDAVEMLYDDLYSILSNYIEE